MKYAIYISKNGEVIGPFTKKELREAVHCGTVSFDDWAWHKELSEWKQLSTLEVSKGALATSAQKEALKAAGLPFDELTTKAQVGALFSAHDDAPASAKQLALLSYFGRSVPENLSKKEGSDIIDAITGHSDSKDIFGDWNDDKLILFPDIFADEIAARKKECFAQYNAFRADLGPGASGLPKLSLDHATRIFAYLDAFRPGWMKPRTAMFLDHFLPCVKSKMHLSPTHS